LLAPAADEAELVAVIRACANPLEVGVQELVELDRGFAVAAIRGEEHVIHLDDATSAGARPSSVAGSGSKVTPAIGGTKEYSAREGVTVMHRP
jgi:hypothetical protein